MYCKEIDAAGKSCPVMLLESAVSLSQVQFDLDLGTSIPIFRVQEIWNRWKLMHPLTGWSVLGRCCVFYFTLASNWYWLNSWARPAILVAGKGRGGFFTFIPVPLSSLSVSFISSTISSVSFLPFSGRQHKMTHKGWHVVKPQHIHTSNHGFLPQHSTPSGNNRNNDI